MGLVRRLLPLGIIGMVVVFSATTGPLTGLMRRQLLKTIYQETRVAEEVNLVVAPMSLLDLARGRIRGMTFTAKRLAFWDGPALEDLSFNSEGISLNPWRLWAERKVEVEKLTNTMLAVRISEEELTLAMEKDLSQWAPRIEILPKGITIHGSVDLFGGGRLPFSASARTEKASGHSILIIPTDLKLAGVAFLPGILKSYQTELSWEFPIELPWPMYLTDLTLQEGYLSLKWCEYNEETEAL